MRRLLLLLLAGLVWAGPVHAATTVTVAWDASVSPEVTGYRVEWGTAPGDHPNIVDAPGPGTTRSVFLAVPGRYFFIVRAYTPTQTSAPSNEVSVTIPPAATDPCAFPLGSTSVSIFVTGRLNKTGSGGPGSGAFITFRAFSPNSPITYLAIRANGVDVPDSVASATGVGDRLASPGSLWFTIPPGTGPYAYAVYAKNAAGCAREQPTGFSTP